MKKYPLISSMSIRKKIVFGTLLVAFSFCAIIVAYSQSISNILLEKTANQVFLSSSQDVNLQLQKSYGPVALTTSILADTHFKNLKDIKDSNSLVPIFAESLKRLPTATGIQVGSKDGDYFILRYLPEKSLKDRFNAPVNTHFVADYLSQVKKIHNRTFFDAKLKTIETERLEHTGYDPRIRPWYKAAMANDESITTSPYVFFFLKEIGITIGKSNKSKTLVIATDITLSDIAKSLKENPITKSSATLIHINKDIVAWSGDVTPLVATADGQLRQKTIHELDHPIFNQVDENKGLNGWLINRSPLSFSREISPELIVAIPKDELLAEYISQKNQMYFISVMLLILLVPVTHYFANRISKPLNEVHRSIEDVSQGNFDFNLPKIEGKDEVGGIVLALKTMRNSIKEHIQKLAKAKAASEKLESELEIARKIQMSMVPGGGNLQLELPEYNLDAKLLPAKAVGGDLYIVISLPEGKYFIAVGDVSDKGVPAALFMSRAVSLAKLLVPKTNHVGTVASQLNDELSEDNDECMFITFFCAVLDSKESSLTVACAGHNPPALVSASGEVKFIEVSTGSPLGLFPGGIYEETLLDFYEGDRLVIYTDGITEAFNEKREEFSDEKLLKTLDASKTCNNIQLLSKHILEEVTKFTNGEPQSDDITLFILEKISHEPT